MPNLSASRISVRSSTTATRSKLLLRAQVTPLSPSWFRRAAPHGSGYASGRVLALRPRLSPPRCQRLGDLLMRGEHLFGCQNLLAVAGGVGGDLGGFGSAVSGLSEMIFDLLGTGT